MGHQRTAHPCGGAEIEQTRNEKRATLLTIENDTNGDGAFKYHFASTSSCTSVVRRGHGRPRADLPQGTP